jgi:hypothetical protein
MTIIKMGREEKAEKKKMTEIARTKNTLVGCVMEKFMITA